MLDLKTFIHRLFQKLEIYHQKSCPIPNKIEIFSKRFDSDLYVENQKFQNFKGRLLLCPKVQKNSDIVLVFF